MPTLLCISVTDKVPTAKELLSDLDFMLVDKDKIIGLQGDDSKCYAQVVTESCHPGYLQLRLNNDDGDSLLRCQV